MGEIVNLRLARKQRRRARDAQDAERNRLRSGQPKAERVRRERERARSERQLDGHRIEPADDA